MLSRPLAAALRGVCGGGARMLSTVEPRSSFSPSAMDKGAAAPPPLFLSARAEFSNPPCPTPPPPSPPLADSRYKPSNPLPDSLSAPTSAVFSPGMAIKGEALPGRPIYLDVQATTPLDPRVLDAMLPFYTHSFGNPHSRTHSYGWAAEAAVEAARAQVAALIGADPKEIVFTSGATEANNMAIKGVAQFYRATKRHIVTTPTEHKCVLDSCRWLEAQGFDTTYVPVGANGLVDVAALEAALRPDTALVSVMGVNNEIGVVQPLAEIGAMCRRRRVFFHTDAAQMAAALPIDVEAMNIDLLSLSGHKLYGPKGVGALYVRRRPRVRLEPLLSGGGQERGLRSGTLPHPLVAGLGAACALARAEMGRDRAWVERLATRMKGRIMSALPHVVLNGDAAARAPGNLNLSFAYVEGESLLMSLKNVAVSSGSACTSASLEPSYVLRAIGVEEDLAHTSIRFGIGRFTTEAEVDLAADLTIRHVRRLREMSPLWEMVQEGIDLKSIQWSQDH
jgi:cysteine desulfurase